MGDKQEEEGEGEVVEQVHGRGWDQHVHVHDHHGQVWQGAQKGGAEEAEMDKVVIIVITMITDSHGCESCLAKAD